MKLDQDLDFGPQLSDDIDVNSLTHSLIHLPKGAVAIFSLVIISLHWMSAGGVITSLIFLASMLPLATWVHTSSKEATSQNQYTIAINAALSGIFPSAFLLTCHELVVSGLLRIQNIIYLQPISLAILALLISGTWAILLLSYQLRKDLGVMAIKPKLIYYVIAGSLFGALSFYSLETSLIFFACFIIFFLLLDLFVDVRQSSLVWLVVWTIVIDTFLSLLLFYVENTIRSERLPIINGFSLFSMIFVMSILVDVILSYFNRSNRLMPAEWDFNLRNRPQLRNRIQLSILLTLTFSFAAIISVAIFQYKTQLPPDAAFDISSTFVQSLLNTSVFLFLIGFVMSVSLAEYIRTPLIELGRTLKAVKLMKSNKKIDWNSGDEIGALIAEYNQMIDKLEDNVNLLAQTERDNAWREMAKQVAHEIKNPLTPMKLSLQHLQRSLKAENSEIKEITGRMCATLMNQVDNLSQIADEFSNFGSLPKTNNEKVLLNDIVETIHDLFRKRGDMDIQLIEPIDDIEVHADKNHLLRVLNNLVKNSIQAIPDDRKGVIELKLWKEGNKAIIRVKDNGIGIKEEMKEQIFKPRFTTKSSGSGLGLAIASNMVDSMGGTVYFKSEADKGTSFYLELPLIRSEYASSLERITLD